MTSLDQGSAQGYKSASGLVLRRSSFGEADLYMTLFLKGKGIIKVSAKGAGAGKVRFGGATEPFVWGVFQYYQGKSGGLYLRDVDVKDLMMPLRQNPEGLFMAVRWARLLLRYQMPEHPSDDLLNTLYWNMRLLSDRTLSPQAADWRFLWRWLSIWGLSPDISQCSLCGRQAESLAWAGEGLVCEKCSPDAAERMPVFSRGDLLFLNKVAIMKTSDIESLDEFEKEAVIGAKKLFILASRCLEGFLAEV